MLATLYAREYYGADLRKAKPGRLIERAREWFVDRRRHRASRGLRAGRLLDVGCGVGEFLAAMAKAGWDVTGVEPSSEAREALPSDLQGRVYGDVDDVALQPFDLITLWHVLEHLADPLTELKRVRRLLRDDGRLFVAVPNFDSWEARLGRQRWFHLDVPRHLYHFTPRTLVAVLERAGYRVDRVSHRSWIYNVFGCFQTLLNLVVPDMNLLYNGWKGRALHAGPGQCLLSYAVAPPALVGAAVLSAVSSCFGASGTMEIEASLFERRQAGGR